LIVVCLLSACGLHLPDPDRPLVIGPLDDSIQVIGSVEDLSAAVILNEWLDLDPENSQTLAEWIRIDQTISERPLYLANKVDLLIDGPMAYAAMFEAMRQARHHIHLETFILDDEEIGRKLATILLERRRANVEVRLIYDAFGVLNTERAYFERLQDHGVRLHKFNPINPLEDPRIWRINKRHHRKKLIVDGRVAFTGGMNISNVYSRSSFVASRATDVNRRWRDTQIRLEGPVVAEFQREFIAMWEEIKDEPPLLGKAYYPDLIRRGNLPVRLLVTGAADREYDIYRAYLAAISRARHRIWLTQGYFAPDRRFTQALKDAAGRGVDVRLLLPGITDSWITINSSRGRYAKLLAAGVRIFERHDVLQHPKTAVVDGIWSTVGSTNLDYRSFFHSNEANAVIYGAEFGRQMEGLFLIDQAQNEEIRLDEWRQRSISQRLKEMLGRLFDYWL
jgi:cardiolipin synthase A/B